MKEETINQTENKKLKFVAWYMELGELQRVGEKAGFKFLDAIQTKEKNGLVFYKVDGETGERKTSQSALNMVRDFGTSVYGVFDEDISMVDALTLIYEKLEQRIVDTNKVKKEIAKQIDKC